MTIVAVDWTAVAALDSLSRPQVTWQQQQPLVAGIPDGILALIAPIIAYWTYAIAFHIVDVYQLLEQYRIHPSEEQLSLNKASLKIVLRDVIFQHIIQSVVGTAIHFLNPNPLTGYETAYLWDLKHSNIWLVSKLPSLVIYLSYWYFIPFIKCLIAFLIIDTWQFFLHRLMHTNKYLYRKFHAHHHQLYVPYAFGALFNNPVEGFLLDTLGTGLSAILLNLSPRETVFLFTFSTLKTVDDHCGYSLPWDIFQRLFPNNSIYHDIHHQRWGIKYNFSQPFFTFWDTLFGTTYHGIDAYREEQKKITVEKYRLFLKERREKQK